MAEQLLILGENLFSQAQFPNHVLAASSEAAGYEVDHLANGRRQLLDRFEPNNTNTDVTLTATCDLLRAADTLVLDRAGNHRGYRYQLLGSADAFTTSRTLWDINPVPSVCGGSPAGGGGCLTTEGAWLKTFDADAHHAWRVVSKAMGSGLKPQVTGLWLGKAWAPTQYLVRFPLEDRGYDVNFETSTSPFGWRGRGLVARGRSGALTLGLPNFDDEAMYARHIETWFLRGYPLWLCWQSAMAPWNALQVVVPAGARVSFAVTPEWHGIYRSVTIPFVEDQPA